VKSNVTVTSDPSENLSDNVPENNVHNQENEVVTSEASETNGGDDVAKEVANEGY